MKRLGGVLVLGAVLCGLSGIPSTLACECTNSWAATASSPEEYVRLALRSSSMVFLGRVTSVGAMNSQGEFPVTFEVQRAWKGIRKREVVLTACGTLACAQKSGCPAVFKEGDEFLVFLTKLPLGECSGQIRMDRSDRERINCALYLKALGQPTFCGGD